MDGDRSSVAFIDYRGHGARRGEAGAFTLAEIAAAAIAAAHELGWSDFILMGPFHGRHRDAARAGRRPDRVGGSLGISPVPSTGVPFTAMRAVQITRLGGPEVLDVVDLPNPIPGEGQQLYDVSTAGVNFTDTHHPLS